MIEEKDFIIRIIKHLVTVLAKGRASEISQKNLNLTDRELDTDSDLTKLFEETTGISSQNLSPQNFNLLTTMLSVNPDPTKLLVTARVLLELGRIRESDPEYRAMAEGIFKISEGLLIDEELKELRDELDNVFSGQA